MITKIDIPNFGLYKNYVYRVVFLNIPKCVVNNRSSELINITCILLFTYLSHNTLKKLSTYSKLHE